MSYQTKSFMYDYYNNTHLEQAVNFSLPHSYPILSKACSSYLLPPGLPVKKLSKKSLCNQFY